MDIRNLHKIGLTNGEIKVYKALLELGESTKTNLAKKSGVAPSNIYDITDRLLAKGMISKIEKNKVAHFSPSNPKNILIHLENKKKEIENEKEIVNQLLPQLISQFGKTKKNVNVEAFTGWNGMKTVFNDLIDECEKGDFNYIFGAGKGIQIEKADLFFNKYSRIRSSKGIKTKIIFNEEVRNYKKRINYFLKSKTIQVKFLQQTTATEILIYKNKSLIIILTNEPIVIRLTGKEVSNSFKQYFNVLWKQAKN
jgi:predicted transcriptional regulator